MTLNMLSWVAIFASICWSVLAVLLSQRNNEHFSVTYILIGQIWLAVGVLIYALDAGLDRFLTTSQI